MFFVQFCNTRLGMVFPVDKLLISLGECVGRWRQHTPRVALAQVTEIYRAAAIVAASRAVTGAVR